MAVIQVVRILHFFEHLKMVSENQAFLLCEQRELNLNKAFKIF